MAIQTIERGDLFGKIGKSFGEGLSTQIPKEIERKRLSEGLQKLSQEDNLTPFERFSKLSAIPGITPQMIQSGSELLKQQATRQNVKTRAGRLTGQDIQDEMKNLSSNASPNINDIRFGQTKPQRGNVPNRQEEEAAPQGNFPSGEPQIVEKNPLAPELQSRLPWTPDQVMNEIDKTWDQYPELTFPEIQQLVKDKEARSLAEPEVYKKQQEDLKKTQEDVNEEIEAQLRRKLQVPKDKEIWDKLSGESHNRIERGVSRDLRKNPKANVKDLVNTWTDRALQNDKVKNEIKKIANRDLNEKIFKAPENLSKLKSHGKSFKEFGNSEEYYNILQSDLDASPEGAASIAYEPSDIAQKYISKIKPSNANNYYENTLKYANDLPSYLTRNDSVLSLAAKIKEKDPFFDIKTFLEEVRTIEDEVALTGPQKLQLNTRGTGEFFPNWGDIFLFPNLGRKY